MGNSIEEAPNGSLCSSTCALKLPLKSAPVGKKDRKIGSLFNQFSYNIIGF